MKYQVEQISGNSFKIQLIALNDLDRRQLTDNDAEILAAHYRQAAGIHLGRMVPVASLSETPNDPHCATIELIMENASI
jgi:hypothetical protein